MASFMEIRTYDDLYQTAKAFAAGKLGFVVVISPPGTGKSHSISELILKDCHYYTGALSPFQLYLDHYEHRDENVVFDDVDQLFASKEGVNLMKCLCDTSAAKTLMWNKASKQVGDGADQVPHSYSSTSRVCVFGNKMQTVEENLGAVLDRGHLYRFLPTPAEVHAEAGKWFKDEEIYGWIGERLHLITQPTMRYYYLAREQRDSGLRWQSFLLNSWLEDPKLAAAIQILSDGTLTTQRAREVRFSELGYGEAATYNRYQKKAVNLHPQLKPKKLGKPRALAPA